MSIIQLINMDSKKIKPQFIKKNNPREASHYNVAFFSRSNKKVAPSDSSKKVTNPHTNIDQE